MQTKALHPPSNACGAPIPAAMRVCMTEKCEMCFLSLDVIHINFQGLDGNKSERQERQPKMAKYVWSSSVPVFLCLGSTFWVYYTYTHCWGNVYLCTFSVAEDVLKERCLPHSCQWSSPPAMERKHMPQERSWMGTMVVSTKSSFPFIPPQLPDMWIRELSHDPNSQTLEPLSTIPHISYLAMLYLNS